MSRRFENLRELVLKLPYKEREILSQELWESLHPPAEDVPKEEIDASWTAEIERRVKEMDSGNAKAVSWERVESSLRRRLPQRARSRVAK